MNRRAWIACVSMALAGCQAKQEKPEAPTITKEAETTASPDAKLLKDVLERYTDDRETVLERCAYAEWRLQKESMSFDVDSMLQGAIDLADMRKNPGSDPSKLTFKRFVDDYVMRRTFDKLPHRDAIERLKLVAKMSDN